MSLPPPIVSAVGRFSQVPLPAKCRVTLHKGQGYRDMKRCEAELVATRAAGVQALVKRMCGGCPCEQGISCPLFPAKVARIGVQVEEDAERVA